MNAITRIHAREVLDSRGRPTVEVDLVAGRSLFGRAIVPSGASTGASEAHELRDGDRSRYDGRGVLQAVAHVNHVIQPALIGFDVSDQSGIDEKLLELDGSGNKSLLGANSLLGVSLAAAHTGAKSLHMSLYRYIDRLFQAASSTGHENRPLSIPLPMINMISGGLHAGGNLDFQDVMIMPVGATDYRTGLEWTVRVYNRLGKLLSDAGYEGRLVGDEGGYGPRLESNRQAVEVIVGAIDAADLQPGRDVTLALDVAASHFFDGTHYRLAAGGERTLSSSGMIDHLEALVSDFPVTSIEDGLAEEDWDGWREMTLRLGDRVHLIGDDLFTTNDKRIRHGIANQAANGVLIKVNQIGTLTETFAAMRLAHEAGMKCVVSARSGETEDTTIADLAVGTRADGIKIGSVARSERLAKYNQLLRIAEELENGEGPQTAGQRNS